MAEVEITDEAVDAGLHVVRTTERDGRAAVRELLEAAAPLLGTRPQLSLADAQTIAYELGRHRQVRQADTRWGCLCGEWDGADWDAHLEQALGLVGTRPQPTLVEITDAAVEAVARVEYGFGWDDETPGIQNSCRILARKALEAAVRLLGPRPLLDRDAVENAIATKAMYYDSGASVHEVDDNDLAGLVAATDAVMALVRPLPTREQIAEALLDAWMYIADNRLAASPETHCRTLADAVLALFSGGEACDHSDYYTDDQARARCSQCDSLLRGE